MVRLPSPLICIHTLWMPPKYSCLLLVIIILIFCMLFLFNFSNIAKYIVATNKLEHWHIIVYTKNLRFCYSVNVYLIVLHFCSLICFGSLIVVCEAIAMLICLCSCVRFTISCSEVNSKFFCIYLSLSGI